MYQSLYVTSVEVNFMYLAMPVRSMLIMLVILTEMNVLSMLTMLTIMTMLTMPLYRIPS